MDKNRIIEYLKKQKLRISSNSISKFRIITNIDILLKSIIFMRLIEVSTADKITFNNMHTIFVVIYLAYGLIIFSFGYLFNKNKATIYYLSVNILYSIFLIFNLWYFRINRDFIGIKNLLYDTTFNPLGESLYQFKSIDILFILDIIIIIFYLFFKKVKCNEKRSVKKFFVTNIYAFIIILISVIYIDIFSLTGWEDNILTKRWTTLMSARASGPIGYSIIESVRTLTKATNPLSSKEEEEIKAWLEYNYEDLENNELYGIAEGKNVIFLQIESLENFVINKTVNQKEITPFLNKLVKEGLYFNNIYEQNNAGNSIDCDFMVNTSIYPLGDKITALNYGENYYSNSLPRILEESGYKTISSHAEEIGEFNWTELHKNGFGVDTLWDISDYIYEETVGYGLSDRSFFNQLINKLENIKQPFFLQVPTLSNHGPFDIDEKYRELDLPKEIDKSYLGGYFESVLYTDRQIESFFKQLDEIGLLDNTMIVIYGDHAGVHKYYNNEIQELNYEGNWWKEYDNRIPLIIYSKDMKASTIGVNGGQVDILPTVLYLLGIEKEKYINTSMGRVLVNTNRDATVIKGNEIKGTTSNEKELEHLLKAYEIGELIIKHNYFNNK